MIQKLDLENFKNITDSYSFGSGNLVTGKNFTGKTGIRQAIECAVLGYVPGVSKTSAAIKQFASAFPMKVNMLTTDCPSPSGLAIHFEKVKSTIKQTEDVTLASLPGFTEQTKVLFDSSIFFDLSDNARISKACELVQSKGGSKDDIVTAITTELGIEVTPGKATKGDPTLLTSYGNWVRTITPKAITVNDLLAESDVYWKAEKKKQSDEKTRMQKAAEHLTDVSTIEAEIAKLPQRHEIEAKKKLLNADIQKLTEQITAAETNVANAATLKANRLRYTQGASLLESAKTALKTAEDNLVFHTDALTKADALQEKYRLAWVEAEKAEKAAQQPVKGKPSTPVRTDDFDNAEPGKRYLVTCTLTAGHEPTDVSMEVVHSWQEIPEEVDNTSAEEEAQARAYVAAQAVSEASEKYNEMETDRQALLLAVTNSKQTVKTCQQGLAAATHAAAELKNLPADTSVETGVENVPAWKTKRDEVTASRDAADTTIQAIVAFEQDKKRIEEAAKSRAAVEALVKTLGQVVDLIAQKKQEIVSLSIEAPLAIANKLADGILKGPLAFEGGEIGMRIGDQFISSRVFSGTESAILFMGLSAGLATRSSLRVLILDELGRLDTPNALRLIDNLAGMVSDGDIDQYIVIGPDNTELRFGLGEMISAGVLNVIQVGGPKQEPNLGAALQRRENKYANQPKIEQPVEV